MNSFRALKHDYECWFLADQNIAYRADIEKEGGRVVDITPRGTAPLRYLADLRSLFRSTRFDTVWLNQTVVNSIEPLVIAKRYGVAHRILHSHSSRNMGSTLTAVLHYLQRPMVPLFANGRFACSQPAAKWFFGNGEYTFIPNAFDVRNFTFDPRERAEARAALGLTDGQITLVHVARFGDEKNHNFTVEVLKALIDGGQSAAAIFVGDGTLRPQIVAQVEGYGLQKQAHFLGMVTDVDRQLQAADVALLPSRFEGLPFTVLEAQAAGLPSIVSTAVSREVTAGGTVKFLPLADGPEAWADALLEMVRNQQRMPGENVLVGGDFDSAVSPRILKGAIAAAH